MTKEEILKRLLAHQENLMLYGVSWFAPSVIREGIRHGLFELVPVGADADDAIKQYCDQVNSILREHT